MIVSWMDKLMAIVPVPKSHNSGNPKDPMMLPKYNSASLAIATPQHVSFDQIELSQIKENPLVHGRISQGKSMKPSLHPKKPPAILKPADTWKHEQLQMLQGRYDFDPLFTIRYKLKQIIGEGSFGFVWIAERKNDQQEVLYYIMK